MERKQRCRQWYGRKELGGRFSLEVRLFDFSDDNGRNGRCADRHTDDMAGAERFFRMVGQD